MSERLKINLRCGFEFVDEETGFTTNNFGVRDNSIDARVTHTSCLAYKEELDDVKYLVRHSVYWSESQLEHSATEVPHVEKIEYVGDLIIEDYGMHITSIAPYGQATKSKTDVAIDLNIIAVVEDGCFTERFNIASDLVNIFKNELSKRLSAEISEVAVTTEYI